MQAFAMEAIIHKQVCSIMSAKKIVTSKMSNLLFDCWHKFQLAEHATSKSNTVKILCVLSEPS